MNEEIILERLNALEQFVKMLREKVESLDKMIFEEIVGPLEQSFKDYQHNTELNDWTDRYYSRLSPYESKIKAIEGSDFNIFDQTLNEYNSMPEDGRMDSDTYIDELTKLLDSQIEKIRQELGVGDNAKIVIEDNGNGSEPEITVEETEETVTEPTTEQTAAENEQETVSADTQPVDEVSEYEKELEAYASKHLKK